MRKRKIRRSAVEILDGIAMAALVATVFIMAVEINAAGVEAYIPDAYIQYCEEAGQAYHICPELLVAIMEEESGGDPDAVGAAGEIGLMQVQPKYHMERLGICSLSDPRGNIFVSADYLAELFVEYKDAGTVLMVYNGTEDAAVRGKCGNYTGYAKRILARAAQLERLHKK